MRDIKLAPCPTCRYEPVSVNTAACPRCGEPITANAKSAMIQGVQARQAQAALEAAERFRQKHVARDKLKEERLRQKINELQKAYHNLLVKCPVCGNSYTRDSGHKHPVPPSKQRKGADLTAVRRRLGVAFAPLTEEEKRISAQIDVLWGELIKLHPRCDYCHRNHIKGDKCPPSYAGKPDYTWAIS
jgi:hypothetical protein